MRLSENQIDIERIRESDTLFRITAMDPVDGLAASIADIGLLHPPVLQALDTDYRIVSGFRRIRACRQTGMRRIPARVLDPDVSRLDCIRWAISDNAFQRNLTLMEQSRAIALLAPLFPDLAALSAEAGRLGLPEHIGMLGKLTRLSTLPIAVQDLVDSEVIPLSMALELARMPPGEAVRMAGLFDELRIGLNRQREILLLVQEIVKRDRLSVTEVLDDPGIWNIRQDPSRDRAQKATLLLEYLRNRRYPAITRNQAEFLAQVKLLGLAPGISLTPPADFEGTEYRFSISFHDIEGLRRRLDSLERAAGHEAMAAIVRRWEIRDG